MSRELKERCIIALVCVGCVIAIVLTILLIAWVSARIDQPTECEWEREIIKESTKGAQALTLESDLSISAFVPS